MDLGNGSCFRSVARSDESFAEKRVLDLGGLNEVCLEPCDVDLPTSRYPFAADCGVDEVGISTVGIGTSTARLGAFWVSVFGSMVTSSIFLDMFAAVDGFVLFTVEAGLSARLMVGPRWLVVGTPCVLSPCSPSQSSRTTEGCF